MKINLEIKKAVVIACAIAIVALSASCGGSGCQGNFTPAPSLGNVTPNTISIAQVPFGTNATFIVNGGNFVQSSVVRVDGMAVATTFINGSQLRATLAASELRVGSFAVVVSNPSSLEAALTLFCENGGDSGSVTLSITP